MTETLCLKLKIFVTDKYDEMCVQALLNPFWIDLVTSWQELCERVRI